MSAPKNPNGFPPGSPNSGGPSEGGSNNASSKVVPLWPAAEGDAGPAFQGRTPPRSEESELAVLAAILQNNAVLERVDSLGLLALHFADSRHAEIFEAMQALQRKSHAVTALALKHWIEGQSRFEGLGGFAFLRGLQSMILPLGGATDAARTILECWQKREILRISEVMAMRVYSGDIEEGVEEIVADASEQIFRIEDSSGEKSLTQISSFFGNVIDSASRAYKRDGLVGVTTGFDAMNDLLGGLHKTDLVIVAGRPGMGKTAFATKIAFNAARALKEEEDELGRRVRIEGGRVAFFSLEMSSDQLAERILSDMVEIPALSIKRGDLQDRDFPTLVEAAQHMNDLPLYIDDTSNMTVAKIRSRSRRMKKKHGLDLIVIDYLQLMSSPGGKNGREENRVQEISAITRGLKNLAKELDVPVVALSQLSRAVEQREDKRPQLSDLRESGSIEQDADVVMFVYRDAYYLGNAEPKQRADEDVSSFGTRHDMWRERYEACKNRAEILVAKQRHGPTGTAVLGFVGMFTSFRNLEDTPSAGSSIG